MCMARATLRTPLLSTKGRLSWMNPLNKTISITFNPLPNFAKKVFQAIFQLKEKLRSRGIHIFWNSLTKSTDFKPKMLMLLESKLLETKPGPIASASPRKCCRNTRSNGFRSGETGKSPHAGRNGPMMIENRSSQRSYHRWCLNEVASHGRWFRTKLYPIKNEDKVWRIYILLYFKTARSCTGLKKSLSIGFVLWRAVM